MKEYINKPNKKEIRDIPEEASMDSPIDINKLRRDLMNFYGTALFAGFDAAMEDLLEIDKESEEEVIKRAIKEGMNLKEYTGLE